MSINKIKTAISEHEALIAKCQKVLDSDKEASNINVSWAVERKQIIKSSVSAIEKLQAML